MVGNGLNVGIN